MDKSPATLPPGPPYYNLEKWDDALEQPDTARVALARGHAHVERWIETRATIKLLDWPTIIRIHEAFFRRLVPGYAGRVRGPLPTGIPVDVEFGNYLGVEHGGVAQACESAFRLLPGWIRSADTLRANSSPETYRDAALSVAATVHCEIIRIHPFVNGNGRTARACLNYFARRYGMRPLPYDRPKGDYLDAIRTFLQLRNHEHFMDYLRPVWVPDDSL